MSSGNEGRGIDNVHLDHSIDLNLRKVPQVITSEFAVGGESDGLASQLKVTALLVKMDFDSVFGHIGEFAKGAAWAARRMGGKDGNPDKQNRDLSDSTANGMAARLIDPFCSCSSVLFEGDIQNLVVWIAQDR